MTRLKLTFAATILAALTAISSQAQARRHVHVHTFGLPYAISYNHNYGPGALPGIFAYYDGPSTNFCAQGSATYRGQDGRRYPCF
jgi:hypothetical protein